MDDIDIEELRYQLRDYLGTAAVTMGEDDPLGFFPPFGFVPPLAEMFEVDSMSDDQVIEEAERLGIL